MSFENHHDTDNLPLYTSDQWSVCIVKPDAKAMRLETEVSERIHSVGLTVVDAFTNFYLPENHLDQIWPLLSGHGTTVPLNTWETARVDYMTSGPIDVLLLRGDDASRKVKNIKDELRAAEYGEGYMNDKEKDMIDRVRSILHTSDSNPELLLNSFCFWNKNKLSKLIMSAK